MRSMKRSGYYVFYQGTKVWLHSCLHENAGMTLGPAPHGARSRMLILRECGMWEERGNAQHEALRIL